MSWSEHKQLVERMTVAAIGLTELLSGELLLYSRNHGRLWPGFTAADLVTAPWQVLGYIGPVAGVLVTMFGCCVLRTVLCTSSDIWPLTRYTPDHPPVVLDGAAARRTTS